MVPPLPAAPAILAAAASAAIPGGALPEHYKTKANTLILK
jgi:hypothetical protein